MPHSAAPFTHAVVGSALLLMAGCEDARHPAAPESSTSSLVGTNAMIGQCVPPPSGMISWWDADVVIGTAVGDIWGSNDGTYDNGAAIAPGKVGQAFDFNTANVVRVASVGEIEIQQFSVDAWVFPRSVGGINDHLGGIIVGKDIGNTRAAPFVS